jgi:hypothetical protein
MSQQLLRTPSAASVNVLENEVPFMLLVAAPPHIPAASATLSAKDLARMHEEVRVG